MQIEFADWRRAAPLALVHLFSPEQQTQQSDLDHPEDHEKKVDAQLHAVPLLLLLVPEQLQFLEVSQTRDTPSLTVISNPTRLAFLFPQRFLREASQIECAPLRQL